MSTLRVCADHLRYALDEIARRYDEKKVFLRLEATDMCQINSCPNPAWYTLWSDDEQELEKLA